MGSIYFMHDKVVDFGQVADFPKSGHILLCFMCNQRNVAIHKLTFTEALDMDYT